MFEFDMLRVDRRTGTMTAEVTVWTFWPVPNFVHSAQLNMSSTQARSTLAKHLAGRVSDRQLDWPDLVENAVILTRNAFRAGEPSILLRDAPEPTTAGALLPPIIAADTQPELDTTSATGRLVFTILAAVAEMERELIRDRVKEGMRLAARRGARIGRPPVTARPGFDGRWDRVHGELMAGDLSRRQAARRLGIGTATLGRMLATESAAAPGSDGDGPTARSGGRAVG